MGTQTIVHGYIETDPCFDEQNCRVIEMWDFDEVYPFTNIFSRPVAGYQSSMISFGGSFKSIQEDWLEWEGKFDALLGGLYCRSAKLCLEDEVDGSQVTVEYLCADGWNPAVLPGRRRWQKWRLRVTAEGYEEVEMGSSVDLSGDSDVGD